MAIFVGSILAAIVMFAAAAFVLWIKDRITQRPLSAEQQEQQHRDYDRRLRAPQWKFVASEFGGQVPTAVENLYRDVALITATDLRLDSDEIACFVPADDDAFDSEQWFNIADDAFVFAVTRFGDPFFVRTSEVSRDLPVYLHYHDGGDTRVLASSLREFVERLRSAPA
jgi:hypothetical protein